MYQIFKKRNRACKDKIHPFTLLYLVLFISFSFYAYLIFEAYLYYYNNQQLFLFDKEYLDSFLSYPGGIAEYIANFLLQFYELKLVGALLFAVFFICIYSLIYIILQKIQKTDINIFVSFIPASLILIMQNHYEYPLSINIKFIMFLSVFLLDIQRINRYTMLIIKVSSLILLYYLAGGWFFLSLSLLLFIYELLYSKDRLKFVSLTLYILLSVFLPYISVRYLFMISLQEAYLYVIPYGDPFSLNSITYFLSLSLPSLLCLLKFISKYEIFTKLKMQVIYGQIVLIYLICFILIFVSLNKDIKNKIKIDYFADNEKWEEIINLYQGMHQDRLKLRYYNNFNTLRALYHTGQLLDRLFDSEQIFGFEGLFITRKIAKESTIPMSALYFDLGHINAAQTFSYEAKTSFPYDPRVYKMLTRTNLINEKYTIAEKFIKILKKSIMHREWAVSYEKYLSNHDLCRSNPLFSDKKRCIPDKKFFISKKNPFKDLNYLLEANPNNKMVHEYIMAYYLLTGKVGNIINTIERFEYFQYAKLPKLIQEAVVIYTLIARDRWEKNPVSRKYKISNETNKNFIEFKNIFTKYKGNKAKIINVLPDDLRKTFCYYLKFTYPNLKKIKVKKSQRNVY